MEQVITHAASAFITQVGASFVRSKISLYGAIILDVKHNTTTGPKDGTMPEGYPAMLANVCELDEKLAAKYCGIAAKALQGRYADKLNDYAASPTALEAFVQWIELNARAEGYTLSLEDLKFFFAGKLSMKAQAAALAQAQADEETKRKDIETQRIAKAAADSAEAKVRKEQSDAAALAEAQALADNIPMSDKAPQQDTEVGTVVIGETQRWVITVSEGNTGTHVDMPDSMSKEALEALFAFCCERMDIMARAESEASEVIDAIATNATAEA